MSRKTEVDEALAAFQRIQRTVMSATWGRWSELDLTIRQMKALHSLGECGELNVGALAERQGTKLPAASILADNLVHAGLVERADDPEDRRRVLLRLTPAGEEVVRRPHEVAALLRSWIERMPPHELSALQRGLRSLAQITEAGSAGAGSSSTSADPGEREPDPAGAR